MLVVKIDLITHRYIDITDQSAYRRVSASTYQSLHLSTYQHTDTPIYLPVDLCICV